MTHPPADGPADRQASTETPGASQALLANPLPAGNGIPAQPAPPGAITHGTCGRWWTGSERSHASCCHETFSSLSAFDAHRKGGRCNPPETVGLVARQKAFGVLWGWPSPEGGHTFHAEESQR